MFYHLSLPALPLPRPRDLCRPPCGRHTTLSEGDAGVRGSEWVWESDSEQPGARPCHAVGMPPPGRQAPASPPRPSGVKEYHPSPPPRPGDSAGVRHGACSGAYFIAENRGVWTKRLQTETELDLLTVKWMHLTYKIRCRFFQKNSLLTGSTGGISKMKVGMLRPRGGGLPQPPVVTHLSCCVPNYGPRPASRSCRLGKALRGSVPTRSC